MFTHISLKCVIVWCCECTSWLWIPKVPFQCDTMLNVNSLDKSRNTPSDGMVTIKHGSSAVRLHEATIDYLDAVNNPFKAPKAARVPDLAQDDTLCLRDYSDVIVLSNPDPVNSRGSYLIFMVYGANSFSNVLYTAPASNLGSASANDYAYGTFVVPLGSDGDLTSAGWLFYPGVNQNPMIGAPAATDTADDVLLENFRLTAGGIKVLPLIEQITNSETIAIANIWAGNVTPGELYQYSDQLDAVNDRQSNKSFTSYQSVGATSVRSSQQFHPQLNQTAGKRPFFPPWKGHNKPRVNTRGLLARKRGGLDAILSGNPVYELLRQSHGSMQFSNNEGATVRYNPFQHEDQLKYISTNTWAWESFDIEQQPYYTYDDIQFPAIVVTLTGVVAAGEQLPFKIAANWWFEGQLLQPSPIYSDTSPCDPNWYQIRAIASDTNTFPCVTSGHSFLSFAAHMSNFLDKTIDGIDLVLPGSKALYSASKVVAKSGKKLFAKKNKKRNVPKRSRNRQVARQAGVVARPVRMSKTKNS